MKCEDFSRMLDNYENLTDEEKLSMNEHAEQCGKCRDELDFMMKIIAELNTLPKIQPPEDFIDKLNKRIDAEAPVRTNRVLAVVRRNYRQLSTVAACLLIAVVVGVNGKSLLDKMPSDGGNDGNTPVAVSTDTPVKEDSQLAVNTASEEPKTPELDQSFQTAAAPASNAVGQKAAGVSSVPAAADRVRNIEPIREMSESINMIEKPDTSIIAPRVASEELGGNAAVAAAESVSNKGRTAQEPMIAAYSGDQEITESKFKIARGVYYLPNADAANAQSTPEPKDDDYVVKIKENKDISIARGRYYVRTNEGYVNIKDNEIEIGSDDAQRALELIEQYIDETADSEYYVINTENITPMLEHMDKEGINYQHNIAEETNERVGFKVKID